MVFICILLVYFWKKHYLYITVLADLSLLFLSPPCVVGPGSDFLSALGIFLILSRSNLPSVTVHLSPAPTYEYSAFSNFPYFLFNIICVVFPDLFQLFGWPIYSLSMLFDWWNLADCVDSVSLISCPVVTLC